MTTRFAPSPTGLLHLGHAYAAHVASQAAADAGGTFLLRLEDIDTTRCRPEFDAAILEDLTWLGLTWPTPVLKQSDRLPAYAAALATLQNLGLLYPCFCTRQEIAAATTAPQGESFPLYPGTCRALTPTQQEDRIAAGHPYAWRLHTARAADLTGPLTWQELHLGPQTIHPALFGDIVLARKEIPTSYHLAVTIDDAAQAITLVTRGRDLFDSTPVHRLLQALLQLPVPTWHHHPLILDASGKRLAKRHQSPTLRSLRESGQTPQQILTTITAPQAAQ